MTTKQDWQPKCASPSGLHCKSCSESGTGHCCQCKAPIPPVTGYVRLQEGNDWGALYLTLPGQALGGTFQTSDRKRGLKFRDGQLVSIRWPDGSMTEESLVHKEFQSQISDHGHLESVTNNRPGVVVNVRGVKHWTPLADLDVLAEDVAPAREASDGSA